jgi:ATP-binding cassette, subfamily B, bacterial MsbA
MTQPLAALQSKLASSGQFNTYKRALAYYKPYWFRAVLGLAASMGVGAMDALMPLGVKFYMEAFLNQGQALNLQALPLPQLQGHLQQLPLHQAQNWFGQFSHLPSWLIPLAIMLFTLVQGIFSYSASYLNTWVGSRVSMDLKTKLYSQLLHYEIGFFDKSNPGEVLVRFSGDVDAACANLIEQLKMSLTRGFSAITLTLTLLFISWKLALLALLVLSLTTLPLANIRRNLKGLAHKSVQLASDIGQRYVETFHGARLMTAYNLQETWLNRLQNTLNNNRHLALKGVQLTGWITPITHSLAGLGVGLVLLIGTSMIQSGELTFPNFSAFLASLLLLYTPVKSLGYLFVQVQSAILAMERVFSLFDRTPVIEDRPEAISLNGPLSDLGEGLRFENVTFAYSADRPVLNDVSFEVKTGQTVALVGSSGSGKTTIASLLPRFYDIQQGRILFDNKDIRHIKLADLRQQMAVVFQDNLMLQATLRDNLLLGRQRTEADLWQALENAYLDTFVKSLPEGLETPIGDHGANLSGGQKQRIAIARAFLAHSPLIILDEATSALDSVSEKVVQQAMDKLMAHKTVLVIAHRLSTIKNADLILVMQEGRVHEQGRHEELLAHNGLYAHLYHTQYANEHSEALAIPSA